MKGLENKGALIVGAASPGNMAQVNGGLTLRRNPTREEVAASIEAAAQLGGQ